MFNKRGSNFDNIDLNNLKSYNNPLNKANEEDEYGGNFNNNINFPSEGAPSKISSKNDAPIIKDMMELDGQFISLMKNRVNNLRSITNSYQTGRLEDSMAKVADSKDLGVINDFFRYAIIKKDLNDINLNIDMTLKIFPNIMQMINSKHDVYFKTGINTAWMVLNYFSEQIMEVIKTPVFNGVDLNREEKINKYKMIIDYFCKIRENPRLQNNLKYKELKGLNLKQFIGEVNFFINQCQ